MGLLQHDIHSTGVYNYDDYGTHPSWLDMYIHGMIGQPVYMELCGRNQYIVHSGSCGSKWDYYWTDWGQSPNLVTVPPFGSCHAFGFTEMFIYSTTIAADPFRIRGRLKKYDSCSMSSCGTWAQNFVSKIIVGDIPSGSPPPPRFTSGLSHRSMR